MAEPRDPLSVVFTELAVSVMPEVRLPGVDAAYVAVRQRRHRRVAVVAAAVAVVLLVPAAAFALVRGTGGLGPDIGGTPTGPASPSGTQTPSGTASPTPTATSEPQPGGLRIIGDRNVRESTPLDYALLPIPSFAEWVSECPVGETAYSGGVWHGTMLIPDPPVYVRSSIDDVVTADVNGDGATDWVAAITCNFGLVQGNHASQILAFTRQDDGPYTLLGQVFVAGAAYGLTEPQVTAEGVVRFIVAGPYESGQSAAQWRSMRWDGDRFMVAGPPEAIPAPEPTELTLTVTPSTLSGPETVLTVSIHNGGSTATDYLELSFSPMLSDGDAGELISLSIRPEGFPVVLQANGGCDGTANCTQAVRLEPVPPGQSATGRFTVSVSGPVTGHVFLYVGGVDRGHGSIANATTGNAVRVPIATG